MFSKILIANRGEIAVRIIRACKEMGIATVAIYSDVDANSLHVALADESYCIGGSDAAASYLNEERIISAALVSGAQAIHPGYGFLAENAHFAQTCMENDLIFIGPTLQNMQELEDKEKVKALMQDAGLMVIPGSAILASLDDALANANSIGYPVMLKARSGGGGRGIRFIKDENELRRTYAAAEAESFAAFGDGALYLEKYINPARHIEVQILADEYGNAVCLGERDCSIQRRNQKLIEETPSPAVGQQKRELLFAKVIEAVRQVKYVGVGTFEFLLDSNGKFYFMEMNVRLQVEHTVTEALTGIDLVKWQIRVAAGVKLTDELKDVVLDGVAIECRINASACGDVSCLHVPGGPFVRFDTFMLNGMSITPYYDPLLGKLVVWGKTRDEALRKMRAALCELVIDGVPNNISEQIDIVSSSLFADGSYDLNYFNE